jgi:hypothetical protein
MQFAAEELFHFTRKFSVYQIAGGSGIAAAERSERFRGASVKRLVGVSRASVSFPVCGASSSPKRKQPNARDAGECQQRNCGAEVDGPRGILHNHAAAPWRDNDASQCAVHLVYLRWPAVHCGAEWLEAPVRLQDISWAIFFLKKPVFVTSYCNTTQW